MYLVFQYTCNIYLSNYILSESQQSPKYIQWKIQNLALNMDLWVKQGSCVQNEKCMMQKVKINLYFNFISLI